MPFFSIIVAALNAEATIENTIRSILVQTFRDVEIIVKDGQSIDRTVSCIPVDSRIKVIVQKDRNLYDGMNQGIENAQGRYCCFLNCGDTFFDDKVLEKVYCFLVSNPDTGIAYGNYVTRGRFVQTPSKTTRYSIYRNPLCHQTMFIDRDLFSRFGLYKENMKILADYEFTVHCIDEGVRCQNTEITVCSYLGGGISTQLKYRKTIDAEYRMVKNTYFSVIERFVYSVAIMATLPRLRVYLASEKAPKLLQTLYNRASNMVKGR